MAIGERLREARMRQRVDVSEVERVTKIRAKYLRALENEEFDLLPGPTYVKSFLRTYADYLGLDSRLMVEEYHERHEPREEEEMAQPFAPSPPPRRQERRFTGGGRPGFGWLVGAGLVGLLALFLLIGLLAGDDGGEPSRSGGGQNETSGEARERSRGEERAERRARSVTLRIAPAEATYACIDRGPGSDILFEGSLSSPRTFRGRRLRLNLGRPSASVRVNGDRVDTGGGADPVGFAFAPNREARRLPLGERPCA
jgi:cytoskeleton protein RodZ